MSWWKIVLWILVGIAILGVLVPVIWKSGNWLYGGLFKWAFGETTVSRENPEPINTQKATEVSELPTSTAVPKTEVNQDIILDFGMYGAYKAVYDSNREMLTLGFWEENMVRCGDKDLADLKREGGNISFIMPKDGWINNSAGQLFVNGVKWDLGNYGENTLEETLIMEGSTITVSYGAKNDSAGFQLWFAK